MTISGSSCRTSQFAGQQQHLVRSTRLPHFEPDTIQRQIASIVCQPLGVTLLDLLVQLVR